MEKITVIIPTFNRAGTIRNMIESIQNQTYNNIEIIVVDNASRDNTEEVVLGINDRRIKYIKFCEYLDVNYSFIRALGQAQTEYVCLFHSDDYYYPDIIEKQLSLLKREDVGAAFSLITPVANKDALNCIIETIEGDPIFLDYTGYMKRALSSCSPALNCPTFMTKLSVLKDVGLLERNRDMISDMSFWLAISHKYKIVIFNQIKMNYFVNSTQLSKKIFENGGPVVISPSVLLLDNELSSLSTKKKVSFFPAIIKFRKKRLQEVISVNKTRKKRGLKVYNIWKYIIFNHPFNTENAANGEKDYLNKLYRKSE